MSQPATYASERVEEICRNLERLLSQPAFVLIMEDGREVTLTQQGEVSGLDGVGALINHSMAPVNYLLGEIIQLDRARVANHNT